MTKKGKNKIKIILALFLAVEQVFFNAWPLLASSPSGGKQLKTMESRYNLNSESLKDFGETANSYNAKGNAPQVKLYFDPSTPKEGEKVTAKAFPTYFKDEVSNLYFTWYLKRKDAEDRNDDGDVDIEDWKIEAARLIAGNSFDTVKNYNVNGSPSGTVYDGLNDNNDEDKDGYEAVMGGSTNKGTTEEPRCYAHDFKNGLNYELRTGGIEMTCSSGSTAYCLEDTEKQCQVKATDDGGSSYNEGGSSNNSYDTNGDGNPDTWNNSTGGVSSLSLENTNYFPATFKICSNTGARPSCDSTTPVCGENEIAACLTSSQLSELQDLSAQSCNEIVDAFYATNPVIADPNTLEIEDFSCENYNEGGISFNTEEPTCEQSSIPERNLCDTDPTTQTARNTGGSATFAELSMKHHLFPRLESGYPTSDNLPWLGDDTKFTNEEEKIYQTDPLDEDTANSGNGDEANAVGLGRDSFSWIYQEGDKVGVAVEGNSMYSTKYADSGSMIMWALVEPCEVKDEWKKSYTANISYSGKTNKVQIETAAMGYKDFQECIEDSLVDPKKGGQSKNIEVNMSYSPENPVKNVTTDNNRESDVITVTASTSNSDSTEDNLKYVWKVYNVSSPGKDASSGTLLLSKNGYGMSTLEIDLGDEKIKLTNGDYLKVTVAVQENFDSTEEQSHYYQRGTAEVSIKVGTNDVPINATACGGGTICGTGTDSLCYIVKNEVVKLSVNESDMSEPLWKLDGKVLEKLESDINGNCPAGSIVFPVLGEPGTEYALSVTGRETKTNGDGKVSKNKTISTTFMVVEPYVTIEGADGAIKPKVLGTYTSLKNGNSYNNESQSILTLESGPSGKVKAVYHPAYIGIAAGYVTSKEWNINGKTTNDLTPTVQFDAGQSIVPVSFSAKYKQSNDVRNALRDNWNVSEINSDWIDLNASVSVEEIGGVTARKKPDTLFASLITNLPGNLLFLLRLVLTIAVVIFVTGAVFSFYPENQMRRD